MFYLHITPKGPLSWNILKNKHCAEFSMFVQFEFNNYTAT